MARHLDAEQRGRNHTSGGKKRGITADVEGGREKVRHYNILSKKAYPEGGLEISLRKQGGKQDSGLKKKGPM